MSYPEKLLERLRTECPELRLGPSAEIVRHRPGRWQRAQGAWAWEVLGVHWLIGSTYSMGVCLAAERLEPRDTGVSWEIEVYPEP